MEGIDQATCCVCQRPVSVFYTSSKGATYCPGCLRFQTMAADMSHLNDPMDADDVAALKEFCGAVDELYAVARAEVARAKQTASEFSGAHGPWSAFVDVEFLAKVYALKAETRRLQAPMIVSTRYREEGGG